MKLKLKERVIFQCLRKVYFVMRITLFFILLSSAIAFSANSYSQNAKFSLHMGNATVSDVLKAIEEQSEFIFFYQDQQIDLNRNVDIAVIDKTVNEILDQLFKGTDSVYKIIDRQIVIGKSQEQLEIKRLAVERLFEELQQPQKKQLKGKVTDAKGEGIPGTTVMVKGTTLATITDFDGNFNLDVSFDAITLSFSFIGFKQQEITIGNKTRFVVVLEEQAVSLEEFVVVGYGVQNKATVTGAISSVAGAKLVQSPVTNLSNAMTGRISGLLTTQGSGAPGQDQTTIRIRGIGTFAGSSDPLIMVDGIEAQNYNNIDPNEIENISVLKDASATAVYGVRGANGVLLITTKRGKIGAPQVSLSSQFAVSRFAEIRKNSGSAEYAQGYNEALHYDSYLTGVYIPKFSETDIKHYRSNDDPLFFPNTDWINLLFKPSTHQTQHNLNISGGTEKVKYFFSVGFMGQDGLINDKVYDSGFDDRMKYDRYNFRSNFDYNITKRLTAKVNLSSQIEELQGIRQYIGLIMSNVFATPPTVSPGIWDGKLIMNSNGPYYNNPLPGSFGQGAQRQNNNQLNGIVRFDYKLDFLVKGLSTHASIAYQNYNSLTTDYGKSLIQYYAIRLPENKYALAPINSESPFGYSESNNKTRKQDAEFGFDYSRTFGNQTIGGLLMYNQTKLFDPYLQFGVPSGYQGIVGRVTYDYKNRYLAEYNFGYNGTENFAPKKRFGFFPAFSLGWVVTEESFFPKNNIISFIKLRGSYGEVGNDRIGGDRFLYRPTSYQYNVNQRAYNFGEVGSTFSNYPSSMEGKIGNPDLTWERAKKIDIGLDVRMWKDKIRLTIDYFDERRDNILANKGTIPNILGATLPAYNFGKMKNGGVDGEINYTDKVGKLNYWLKGIFTITHNVVQFQDEVNRPYSYQLRTGQRFGQEFGLVAEGVYNSWEEVNDANRPVSAYNSNKIQPGDFRYKDVNGDGIINEFDQVPIGYSAFPEQSYGFSFGGDFKGFDISVLFQGITNFSHLASKKFYKGWQEDGSAIAYLNERSWTQEKYIAGIKTDFPHVSASSSQVHNYESNTFWLEDASFLRLKNVEVGYTLTSYVLKRLGVRSVRVYLNGNNLLTWHNMLPGEDPEIPNYSDGNNEPYPLTKTYNGGINVKF